MSDDLDRAHELEEAHRERSLRRARLPSRIRVRCGEPIPSAVMANNPEATECDRCGPVELEEAAA